jgi:hypothetical protein
MQSSGLQIVNNVVYGDDVGYIVQPMELRPRSTQRGVAVGCRLGRMRGTGAMGLMVFAMALGVGSFCNPRSTPIAGEAEGGETAASDTGSDEAPSSGADASVDGLADHMGSSADVVFADVESEDGTTCPSLDNFCVADGGPPDWALCNRDWASAQARASWCTAGTPRLVEVYQGCHGFNLVVVGRRDTSVVYWYDSQSGQLIGIDLVSPVSSSMCIAGAPPSATFGDCSDGSPPTSICDGHTDASAG